MRRSKKTSRSTSPSSGKGKRAWLKRMKSVLAWSIFTGVIGSGFLALYFLYDLPSISKLTQVQTFSPSITILDRNDVVIARVGQKRGNPVEFEEIPRSLVQAILATEDRRFFEHHGFDIRGLGRALLANVTAGGVRQGGSTITQQLAKLLFLSPDRTIKRKVQELVLAIWLETKFSKEEILALYVNQAYYGAGSYGVDAAARTYFNKSAREINLSEAAVLAGLLKSPSRFSPHSNPELALWRAEQVMDNMYRAGYLKSIRPVEVKFTKREASQIADQYEYFADWIEQQMVYFVDSEIHADLVVKTTLDRTIQDIVHRDATDTLKEFPNRKIGNVAMVVMRPDGEILAMLGGTDFKKSQFNRVSQAMRQPGSTFKFFVYLAALEVGIKPNSRWVDEPVNINGWAPENHEGKYRGKVDMAEAFAFSSNSVAVQVARKIGIPRILTMARRLGVQSPLHEDMSMALGTGELTLLELTQAYAHIAHEGKQSFAYGVVSVRDVDGKVYYQREREVPPQMLPDYIVEPMRDMLKEVIDEGTGEYAQIKGRDVYGKTGTSQDYRDAWFVGFTEGYVGGVWAGNDDNTSMKQITGGVIPAMLWKRVMKDVIKAKEDTPWQ